MKAAKGGKNAGESLNYITEKDDKYYKSPLGNIRAYIILGHI